MVTLKTERATEAFRHLNSTSNPSDTLKSLRYIKNAVIGNPTRKKYFLDQGISERYFRVNLAYLTY